MEFVYEQRTFTLILRWISLFLDISL